jgi:hypothetical protein
MDRSICLYLCGEREYLAAHSLLSSLMDWHSLKCAVRLVLQSDFVHFSGVNSQEMMTM